MDPDLAIQINTYRSAGSDTVETDLSSFQLLHAGRLTERFRPHVNHVVFLAVTTPLTGARSRAQTVFRLCKTQECSQRFAETCYRHTAFARGFFVCHWSQEPVSGTLVLLRRGEAESQPHDLGTQPPSLGCTVLCAHALHEHMALQCWTRMPGTTIASAIWTSSVRRARFRPPFTEIDPVARAVHVLTVGSAAPGAAPNVDLSWVADPAPRQRSKLSSQGNARHFRGGCRGSFVFPRRTFPRT